MNLAILPPSSLHIPHSETPKIKKLNNHYHIVLHQNDYVFYLNFSNIKINAILRAVYLFVYNRHVIIP